MSLAIVRTVRELRAVVAGWRGQGQRVGLVPTMGALHDGHLSLVAAALSRTDRVIVTLFVNPKQFNSADDLAAYPRTETGDAAMLEAAGAHLLFAPDAAEIYPDGFATTVAVADIADGLEGAFRPAHFNGVATVCAKLFLQSSADLAFFGEKDFQQLQVVTRMARDLDMPIGIVGCPTLRAPDGLALSSRNVRLSPQDRVAAATLARALFLASDAISHGEAVEPAIAKARAEILAAGFTEIDYLELRAEHGLGPLASASEPARLLAAAWIGGVRLIDNVRVAQGPARDAE